MIAKSIGHYGRPTKGFNHRRSLLEIPTVLVSFEICHVPQEKTTAILHKEMAQGTLESRALIRTIRHRFVEFCRHLVVFRSRIY